MEVVWISDLHFGLKTDGIDRNEEIYQVTLNTAKYAAKLKKSGKDTVMVIGGDIFNTNSPSEDQIHYFTRVLAFLHKQQVKTYVMVGNHDVIFDKERKSCLSLIRNLNIISPFIELIEDITNIKVKTTDYGFVYFTFLPHITKNNYEESLYKSPQDYINKRCEDIVKKVGMGSKHYVFSHLNVVGAIAGSEANLLKKSEVFVPECLQQTHIGGELPKIINGHIHSFDQIGNITIVGSPIFCTFGENLEETKRFLHLTIPENFNDVEKWHFEPTNCTIFKEVNFGLFDVDFKKTDFLSLDIVKDELDSLDSNKNYYYKINVKLDNHENYIDWEAVRLAIAKPNVKVKPIIPSFVATQITRVPEQKITLAPIDAVKVFLTTNRPLRMKEKFKLAKHYLGEL
jgi:DNA repair exonuclease SbcCD nuclease subunit